MPKERSPPAQPFRESAQSEREPGSRPLGKDTTLRESNTRALQATLLSLNLDAQYDFIAVMLGELSPIVPENIWTEVLTRSLSTVRELDHPGPAVAEASEVAG